MKKTRKTNLCKRRSSIKTKSADPFYGLVDEIPLGLHRYQLKPNGDLTFRGGNPAADRILGIDHQGLIGKSIEVAFPNLAHTDIPDTYRRIAKNGGNFEREFVRYQDEQVAGIFKVQAFQTGPDSMAALFQDIRDKKQTEHSLSESEGRFRRLFESAVLGIFQSSPQGKALAVNPAFVRMFGYSSPEDALATIQNVATDIFADPNRRAEIMRMVQENPEQNAFENIYRRKDGSTFTGTLHLHPVKDEAGHLLFFEGLIEDISERKQAEKQIHDLARFTEENPNPVARVSQEGDLLSANQAAVNLLASFGLRTGQPFPPDWKEYITELLESQQSRQLETQHEGRTYSFQLIPVPNEGYLNAYGLDITKRREAESAHQESERRIRALIDAAPFGLHQYELLANGRLILTGANAAADQILRIDHQAMLGLSIEDAFPTHRQTEIPAIYRQVAQEGIPYSCEQIAYQDEQIQGVYEIHAFQTGPNRMAVFFQDKTEKKKAEEALRESEEKFRTLIEQNSEGVVLYDEQGRVIEWNTAQETCTGISRQEALGRPVWDIQFRVLLPEHRTPARLEAMEERGKLLLQTGQSPIFYKPVEISIQRTDGTPVVIQQTAFPIKTGLGFRIGSIMRDITDQKKADLDRKQQMDRLTALRVIDQSILSRLGLDQTLEVLLDKITGLLQVDAADILLYNPRMKTLKAAARRGLSSLAWEGTLLLGESHAGRAAQTMQIEILPDLSQIEDSLTEKIRRSEEDFTGYGVVPLVALGELKGVLQIFTRARLQPSLDWMGFLEALADQAAIAINSAQLFNEQQQTNARLTKAYEDTIDGWSHALDLRDNETEGHSQRVTDLTLELARRMNIPEDQMVHIRRGAKLHDIGKMGIPDRILLKPGPLTASEWEIMRQHPTFAADLLLPIEFLSPALEIPFGHHEKWDGTGYPQGLKGEEIPLSARIFAVIDVWDALTHRRPYRPAWTEAKAIEYIYEQIGKHFDPRVVNEFLALPRDGLMKRQF